IDLKNYIPHKKFDLIYFDAFAPDKQPKLWTNTIFKILFDATNKNGILVTYSAKGTVKQALRNSGFFVKRLKGPIGKRHMIKAIKL
ncbi:MAG: transcriptional regulator, partial [Chlorobi bacterium]|nr:transcriptional regulator [Chlorobiota bacterium]